MINISGCAWFTFYPVNHYCNLLKNCDKLTTEECDGKVGFFVKVRVYLRRELFSDCLSGEGQCEATCFIVGECEGEIIKVTEEVNSR